jgi:hypothetical protein
MINLGAAAEPLQVPAILLLIGRRSVVGWTSGSSIDSRDTLSFTLLTGARCMTELFPAGAHRRGLRTHDERQGTLRAVLSMGC